MMGPAWSLRRIHAYDSTECLVGRIHGVMNQVMWPLLLLLVLLQLLQLLQLLLLLLLVLLAILVLLSVLLD